MPAETTVPQAAGSASAAAAREALASVLREPGAKKPDPIVVADNITRTFGGLTSVDVEQV